MTSDNPQSDSASSENPSDKGSADKPLSNDPPLEKPQSDKPRSDKAASNSSEASATKPRIGDSRPAPASKTEKTPSPRAGGDDPLSGSGSETRDDGQPQKRKRRRRSNSASDSGTDQGESQQGSQKQDGQRSRSQKQGSQKQGSQKQDGPKQGSQKQDGPKQQNSNQKRGKGRQRQRGGGASVSQPVQHVVADAPVELDEKQMKRRRGRSRKGRPVGRYMMVVSKREESTHIAVVEGRQLVEYVVSRPSDDVTQIHGNIYLGKVQNVLPGMEAAFVDVGTPKNAVLYRSDVTAPDTKGDKKGSKKGGGKGRGKGRGKARGNSDGPKIEELLKPRQMVLCQVVKNPIAHKGARLTMEVSLPGRFVVLVPNSDTYGISKRLPDSERKRLRQLLDRIRPKGHGLIVRTAAENVTAEEIERDVLGLQQQWNEIDALAKRTQQASLLYREPDMSTRVIREEFNMDYRAVIIDNEPLYEEISDYVSVITPALAERVEFYDAKVEPISVFERYHIHEQLHKALDRKVWLPSGGSLIIEGTEALTVIDVNTGKNVGSSSLEETVFRNNLEAAEEVAHQLRLRDIGGIIVIDFVDMEDRKNREEVIRVFRKALSRDKTRTQAFGISDLGLVEMTRKRIGEGLVESMSGLCPDCEGRGLRINEEMIDKLLR